jgi:hypothetical protein
MAKHVKKTTKYYQSIAQRAIKILATIDIYGFSAD